MTDTQQRFSTYDRGLLGLVTALDKWQHLLRCAKVTAYTDHPALTYSQRMLSSKLLGGRTARWLEFLVQFKNLTITYLQGTTNNVADALPRHPLLEALGEPTVSTPDTQPLPSS